MPITVQHTPYDALYSLATKAGTAMAATRAQEQRDRQDLVALQGQQRLMQQKFAADAANAARGEEMQFQMDLLNQRKMVDIELSTRQYARDKEKLQQAMNMINDSGEFSDRQKEELRVQATAKYANVGTGISPSSFDSGAASKKLQNEILLGSYRTGIVDNLQEQVDSGELKPFEASRRAIAQGITGIDFKTPMQEHDVLIDKAVDRLKEVQNLRQDVFDYKKGYAKDAVTGEKITKKHPRWEHFQALQKQEQAAVKELQTLYGEKATAVDLKKYLGDRESNPYVKQLEDSLGPERAFTEWRRTLTGEGLEGIGEQSFLDRHPILKNSLWLAPGFNVMRIGATKAADKLKDVAVSDYEKLTGKKEWLAKY